jgi:hypothetical protein
MEEVFSTPALVALVLEHCGRRPTLRQVCAAWRKEIDDVNGTPEPS